MKKGQEKNSGQQGLIMFLFSFNMLMLALSIDLPGLQIFEFVMCGAGLIYGIYCIYKWKKWKAQNTDGENDTTEPNK